MSRVDQFTAFGMVTKLKPTLRRLRSSRWPVAGVSRLYMIVMRLIDKIHTGTVSFLLDLEASVINDPS